MTLPLDGATTKVKFVHKFCQKSNVQELGIVMRYVLFLSKYILRFIRYSYQFRK